jgi:hypothetical protein
LLVPVGFWERGGVCIVVDVDVDVWCVWCRG